MYQEVQQDHLRYMDRYVTITQGEVFYMTELLAQLEGLRKRSSRKYFFSSCFCNCSGNDDDQIIVVQETEYTGAGKHIIPQLNFAKENGIEVKCGNPEEEVPGENINIPSHPSIVTIKDIEYG